MKEEAPTTIFDLVVSSSLTIVTITIMNSVKLDLIKSSQIGDQLVDLQVQQGATYELTLSVPGNNTLGAFRGEIRTDFLANIDNTLLASFEFNNVAYSEQTGKTTFIASIPATATDLIPPTFKAGKGVRGEINDGYYVYDIKYQENDRVVRYYEGLVEVTPQTTNGGTP